MRELLESLEQLFKPVDGWGEFRKGARPAAVTFILYRQADRWMVPFVRRRADMRDHPGQVALPGGGVKPGESAWEAAQREVAEEIGVPVGRMVPLGAGDPIYAAVTNFSVVPFVAYLPGPVESFVHDERELEGVLAVGFALHNITEGFGIAAPMTTDTKKASWGFLGLTGLIGGGPTFIGTWIGYLASSTYFSVAFLAVAAGALLYVLNELFSLGRKISTPTSFAWGLLTGFLTAYATDLFLTVATGA